MMRTAFAIVALGLALGGAKSDPLAGRIAGKPVQCIDAPRMSGPQIVDADTILYSDTGRRIWKTGPRGACPSLRPLDTLIVEINGGQLCRNDRFRTVSNGLSIPSGPCLFRDFTPYDLPARR